ncbi:hypothetical protein WKH56_06175 [Priestia sp. SB1]|uniref:hypothetical protein n=1 Tax=Priestia sp. SB1 TaxID=3132359 RepID=UPI003177CB65
MERKVRRLNYNFYEMDKYAKESGKKLKDLSDDEREPFVLGPLPFNHCCLRMLKYAPCYICEKETPWLDRKHGIYLCNKECMKVADLRYEVGEDFNT